jgi:protein-disulfide isomerase
MKYFLLIVALCTFSSAAGAQTSADQVLAIAAGQRIAVRDLPDDIRAEYEGLARIIAEKRTELLEVQIIETLTALEAAQRRITVEELFNREVASKVADPTEAQIKEVYDANRSSIGDRSLAEVRPQIIGFLRAEPEQKEFNRMVTALKARFRVTAGKNVNGKLLPADALATVGPKRITAAEFEAKHRITLFERKAEVYDHLADDLRRAIYSILVSAEAKSLGIESYQLIAAEISDKMREFTEDERESLETALYKRLAAKHKVQMLYTEPVPPVFNIATAGDPSRGSSAAPVTVVMFSDFQCSACAARHPILQRVISEYGSQVRFVVRDFPLSSIHKNAYNAALAAGAAAAQGKFFEYTEILYRNQDALDVDSLKRYAAAISLNMAKFELDFQSEKVASDVRKDIADGKAIGVSSTPSIYVNGVRVRRMTPVGFREAIDRALKK